MSDDDDYVLPANICATCGFARGPNHVCRTDKKPMRFSERQPKPSAYGKRAREESVKTCAAISIDSDEDSDDELLPPAVIKKRAAAKSAMPASQPDPHAFLTSILHDHSTLKMEKAQMEKDLIDAATDKTKLTTENEKLLKDLTKAKADLAKAKAATTKEKKEKEKLKSEAASRANEASAAAFVAGSKAACSSSTGLKPVASAYGELIDEVRKQYSAQIATYSKSFAPTPTAPPAQPVAPQPPAPPVPQYPQIQQFNTNPQYPTTREIKFWSSSDIAMLPLVAQPGNPLWQSLFPQPGFYFEDGIAGSQMWRLVQDQAAKTQLLTLGNATLDAAGSVQGFTPILGKACQYTVGQHTYSVASKLLFQEETPVEFKAGFLTSLLNNHDWGGDDSQIVSPDIAALAELFSSLGQGFKYDTKNCFLWCKPDWFKLWLRTAITRGYNSCRIGMHGAAAYDGLGKDVAGYDMGFSRSGIKKHALYVAASDHIASDYNVNAKRGSCMIGLLLTKRGAASGAYEKYNLGSRSHTDQSRGFEDAIAVRDQLLWLPLGKAVAR